MKSGEQYEEAIECLKEKEKEEGIENSYKQKVLNEKAGCYVEWIKTVKIAPEKTRDLLKDIENAMDQIKIGNESKLKPYLPIHSSRWRYKTNESQLWNAREKNKGHRRKK